MKERNHELFKGKDNKSRNFYFGKHMHERNLYQGNKWNVSTLFVHFIFFFFFCLFFSLASYILVLLICWLRRECIFENKLSNIIFFKGQCTVLGSTSNYLLKNFTESSFYGHFSKIPRKMHLADSYFRKVALLQLGKNSVTSVFFEILWEISE